MPPQPGALAACGLAARAALSAALSAFLLSSHFFIVSL
jgi:hypothetical protein